MGPVRHRTHLFRIAIAILTLVMVAVPVIAQTTTATLRGKVTDDTGSPVGGAEVNAINTATGFNYQAISRSDGSYTLAGLTPGNYTIVVAAGTFEPRTHELTFLVGQSVTLDFEMSGQMSLSEAITVVGEQIVETETSQITTNVTREQIESLPQNNRNFMNFAELAPGVRVSDGETNRQFAAGAQTANAVNVFVDSVSLKNDVLNGGVIGQDASRGNPFPQNAVQEFRVLTQNYSAEFQKSSSAVITAITKSGTNDFSGEVFGYYQDKDFVDRDPCQGRSPNCFAERTGTLPEKSAYERLQAGISLGGPIIRDRMHFFISAEINDQDRENTVVLGTGGTPAFREQFRQFEGTFVSPFESNLFFAKGTYQPTASQIFDVSGYLRDETEVRGFGGQTSIQSAEEFVNDVWQIGGRHQFTSQSWFNEASVSYQDFQWNPQPLNEQDIGRNYQGIIRIGGRDTEQNFNQKRFSLRDDITFSGIELGGDHLLKVGANVDILDYSVFKAFTGNPIYEFRQTENYAFPFQARYGLGDPDLSTENTQFGIYVQDRWTVTDQFAVDLGLRYDYETDMFPTDYVTPQRVRDDWGAVLLQRFGQDFVDNYFTDGNDRSDIDDMIAPRLGLTYDVFNNSRTVAFGGWGRYYDRVIYNASLDERFRLQYSVGTFRFSETGAPTSEGFATVAWEDRFLTEAGLQELLALGVTGQPELFLIENNTEAPYSDQWNVGVRQALGPVVASLSYANIRSHNGFTFIRGDLRPDNTCCLTLVPGYSRLILSNDEVRTWYDAIYFTLEKPFTGTSRWGGQLAYTYNDATQEGGDLFSLDAPRPSDYPRYRTPNVEDHRLVASGLVRLPFQITFGGVLEYGSGLPYNINDRSLGEGINQRVLRRGAGEGADHTLIDLRLEKGFGLPGGLQASIVGEAFNVTDEEFYTNYDGDIPVLPAVNANFGKPRAIVGATQRRYQVGLRLQY